MNTQGKYPTCYFCHPGVRVLVDGTITDGTSGDKCIKMKVGDLVTMGVPMITATDYVWMPDEKLLVIPEDQPFVIPVRATECYSDDAFVVFEALVMHFWARKRQLHLLVHASNPAAMKALPGATGVVRLVYWTRDSVSAYQE